MKTLLELTPIGIGVSIIAALTWFLLSRDIGIGTWLLAALLFAHGWVHLMFLFPAPETAPATPAALAYPFDMSRPWLISSLGLDPGLVRTIGIGVIVVTFGGFAMAALATIGWLVPEGWWAGLILASAAGLDAGADPVLRSRAAAGLRHQRRALGPGAGIGLEPAGERSTRDYVTA